MSAAPYAECDLDAIIAIRGELPPPRGVADVVTATGTVRAVVAPDVADPAEPVAPSAPPHPFCHYE